jgi:VWFA-related protein
MVPIARLSAQFEKRTIPALKAFCLPALLVLFVSAFAPTGHSEKQQEINIRVKTELIQLRAVVTNRQGQPIDNLSKEDFVLLEDGQPQAIGLFSVERIEIEARPQPGRKPAAVSGEAKAAGRPSRLSVPSRSIVLLVDTLHTSFTSLANTRAVLRHFLNEQMTDQDLVALMTPTGMLGLMEQFTKDRQLLNLAIERLYPWRISQDRSLLTPFLAARIVRGDPDAAELAIQILADEEGLSVGDEQGLVFDPRDRNKRDLLRLPPFLQTKAHMALEEASYYRRILLTNIRAAVEKLAEMPGQRIIALFSEGCTMVTASGDMASSELQTIISEAARSGVLIYTFDAKGLVPVMVPAWMQGSIPGNRLVSYLGQSLQDSQDSMKILAEETGGEACYNTNNLSGGLQKMLADNRIYYELAYYPSQDKDPRKLRRIVVSVKDHPEYVVRAQRSYLLSELRRPRASVEGQAPTSALQKAISHPLPLMDVGVTVFAEFLARGRDQAEIELQLQVQGGHLRYRWEDHLFLSELELAGVVYQLDGKPIRSLDDRLQMKIPSDQLDLARSRGFRFVKRIDIPPGLYHIRMGVRDLQSERLGTAFAWVEVPDLKKGKLIFSRIFLPEPAPPVDKQAIASQNTEDLEPKEVNGLRLVKRGEDLTYGCMIYNAPLQNSDDDLKMQLELYQDERRIYLKPWFPVLSPSRAKDKVGIEVTGQLELHSLQPGVFELRASLKTAKSNQTAQRAISFIVTP